MDSPDIIQNLVPLSDIGAVTTSMASIKLSSMDNYPLKLNSQVRSIRMLSSNYNYQNSSTSAKSVLSNGSISNDMNRTNASNSKSLSALPETVSVLPELSTTKNNVKPLYGQLKYPLRNDVRGDELRRTCLSNSLYWVKRDPTIVSRDHGNGGTTTRPLTEFNLSSVGRSFIDENDLYDEPMQTPESPTPNVSPTNSQRISDTFSNDFVMRSTSGRDDEEIDYDHRREGSYCSSWDLLELDLNLHEVNLDPSFGCIVTECEFLGDDDIFRYDPTPTNSIDL